ncbi:hypothetical protein Rhopal_002092-T1 [Rhodotorula paludigena]|uniref:Nucleolus and neural progenitor protein-like N-terminal domain-containing protein n=1 Tax=Rhodotorula paludigena TaxID=86838 RepID=A0AAV5GG30_9BASI|nr:hypothetical protein Rhopal_002092-T1 [Rhodotorula paludigena]
MLPRDPHPPALALPALPPAAPPPAFPGLVSSLRPLRRLAPALADECALLRRFTYKHRNQHKGHPWWKRIHNADRSASRALHELSRWLAAVGAATDEPGALTRDSVCRGLVELPRVMLVVDHLVAVLLDCAGILEQLVHSRAFLAFALVVVALVARLHALAAALADECARSAATLLRLVDSNGLSPVVQPHLARLPRTLRRFLPLDPSTPSISRELSLFAPSGLAPFGGGGGSSDELGAAVARKPASSSRPLAAAAAAVPAGFTKVAVAGPARVGPLTEDGKKKRKKKDKDKRQLALPGSSSTPASSRRPSPSPAPLALLPPDSRPAARPASPALAPASAPAPCALDLDPLLFAVASSSDGVKKRARDGAARGGGEMLRACVKGGVKGVKKAKVGSLPGARAERGEVPRSAERARADDVGVVKKKKKVKKRDEDKDEIDAIFG